MTNHPLIEIHLRLIGALQKGYIEALEAGDWQAADYRCSHLNKLTQGLYYLSQSLEQEREAPLPAKRGNEHTWLNSVRAIKPTSSSAHSPKTAEQSTTSQAIAPEPSSYEWGIGNQGIEPPPINEVWK